MGTFKFFFDTDTLIGKSKTISLILKSSKGIESDDIKVHLKLMPNILKLPKEEKEEEKKDEIKME